MIFEKALIDTKNLVNRLKESKTIFCPKIILGLSGGPDSVFLFHVFKKMHDAKEIIFTCAHLNHGWRKEAVADENFCVDLCRKNSIPIVARNAVELDLSVKFNGSQEDVGRRMRRHFFEDVLEKSNADFIALAHHMQDQQETFFLRILRGSSLAGLRCMDCVSGPYIRPLLDIDKQEILRFLRDNKIDYCMDVTNESDDFLRNRIRNHVLPALKMCDDRFDGKFESTLKNIREEDDFIKDSVEQEFSRIFTRSRPEDISCPNKSCILTNACGDVLLFRDSNSVIQKRLVVSWLVKERVVFSPSSNFIKEVIRFLLRDSGGVHRITESWKIHKKKNVFWICKT
jgi:tRNA(Ile)-lysidine synthetase-like protein